MATDFQTALNQAYPTNKADQGVVQIKAWELSGNATLKEFINMNDVLVSHGKINDSQYFNYIQSIPSKDKMWRLYFWDNNITDPNFEYIGNNFPNIQSLIFDDNPFKDGLSVKGLSKLTKLKELSTNGKANTLKDINTLPPTLTRLDNNTNPEFIKSRIDLLQTQNDKITQLTNNQEKHKPEDLEKHKPEDLKPADYETLKSNYAKLEGVFKDVGDYYVSIGLTQYGDYIDRDSLKKIKDKLDALQNDLNTANGKITTLEGEKTKLTTSIADKDQQLAILTNDNKSKDTTISDLNNTINDKNIVIDKLKDLPDKIVALNKQLNDKDTELGKRNDAITTLTSDKIKAEGERDQNKTDLIQANKDKGDLTTKLNDKNGELKTWTDTFGTDKKPTEIKNKLDDLNNRPNINQENYNNLLNNQEKHKPEDLEKHKLEDLKPIDYDDIKKKLNDWQANFPNQQPNEVKNQVSQQGNQGVQANQYLNKLLEIYKVQIKRETEAFYLNDLKLDENYEIRPKYNGIEYLNLLDKLNGDSKPQQVINAFKIVALICAVDKAQKLSDKYTDETGKLKPIVNSLGGRIRQNNLIYFNDIKKFWEINNSLESTEVNNPLYLSIIKDKETYKNKLDQIIQLWQAKTNRQLRVIDLSIFPTDKTTFGILQEQKGRKNRVQKFIDEIKVRFPSASAKIGEYTNKYSTTWNNLDDGSSSYDDFLSYFNYYNHETDLINLVNQDALKEIGQLFGPGSSDNELTKFLKEIANDQDQKDLMKDNFDDLQGGVSWVFFVTNNFKNFYLSYLPDYINDQLKIAGSVKLEEVKAKIKPVLIDIFASCYSDFVKVDQETDLAQFKNNINNNLENLKKLITENNEDLKIAKEKYKKEDKDGKSWTLTASEKNRIDQAANEADLEKVVQDIMHERDEAAKIDKWVKDKITSKTKLEELLSEADIENTSEIPTNAKDQVKRKLREKIVELMPETTAEERIKKHLMGVKFKWEKWSYLVEQKDETDPLDYSIALMFDKSFRKTVAQEMLPKITAAIAKNTMEGYQDLDKEWGQGKIDKEGEVEYNKDRDYFEVWKTLREFLKETEVSKYKKVKEYLTTNHYGEKRWNEIEVNAQIEVKNK